MDGHPFPVQQARFAATAKALPGLLLAVLCVATGCASQGGVRQAVSSALQTVRGGDSSPQPATLPIRLRAADNLNAGDGGRPGSLVVRVYQLRARERFEDAAFDVFVDEQRERDVLGDDLLRVTEVLLAPGQDHGFTEALAPEGRHVGVVALFREPARTRWRLTFDARSATNAGITVGLHACAMSTASPQLQTRLADGPYMLASSRCVSRAR